jgi:type IV secretory pathway TraG/TraD family ATPase VirD4
MISITPSPVSLKRNDWFVITSTFMISTIVLGALTTIFTWRMFSNWGNFVQHLSLIIVSFGNGEYLHLASPFILSAIFSFCLVKKLLYAAGGKTNEVKTAGPEMITSQRKANIHARKQLKKEGKEKGLHVHPLVQISRDREKRNIAIFGSPGTGKSVITKSLLNQINDRQDRLVLFDEKGEYTEFLYDEKTILIAPWDSRTMHWDVATDLSDEQSINNFCSQIIAKDDKAFWYETSVQLLAGMINAVSAEQSLWRWSDLIKLMELDEVNLKELVQKYRPSLSKYFREKNETSGNIMMNLVSNIGWMQELAKLETESDKLFSIKGLLGHNNNTRKVIIQSHDLYRSLSAPLFSAFFTVFVNHILSQDSANKKATWLVLDEFSSVPKTEAFQHWIALSREKEGRTIIGTQSVNQIFQIYGKEATNSIMSMFGNVICLGVSSLGDDATYLSKSFGTQTLERGTFQNNSSYDSISWTKDSKNVLEPHDLSNLPLPTNKGVTGFLSISGWSATYKLTWPFPVVNILHERTLVDHKLIKLANCATVDEEKSKPERVVRRQSQC